MITETHLENMFTETHLENMSPPGDRLRVGLLLNRTHLPGPASQLLERMRDCGFIDVVAVVRSKPAVAPATANTPFLYDIFRMLDAFVHPEPARALAPHDCTASLASCEMLDVDYDPSGARLRPSDSQRASILAQRLDLILVLDPALNPLDLIGATKHGIWRCWLGEPAEGGLGMCRNWRLINRNGSFSTKLDALTATDSAPLTLAVGTMSLASEVSVLRNLAVAAAMGLDLIMSALQRLQSKGWDYLLAQSSHSSQPETDAADTSAVSPTNCEMLGSFSRQFVRFARRKLRERRTREHWRVGIRFEGALRGLAAACSPQSYGWIDAPPGHYYADPFLITQAGRQHLFVEGYDVAVAKGYIAHLPIDSRGRVGAATTVLDLPYHLSYPCVFAHAENVYMVPDSGFNNKVEIYRANDFPLRWERIKVLFHGPAADTTVFFHDGLFWFFVTLFDVHSPSATRLMLFYSPTLLGDLIMHPASPISTDIHVARSAGAIFADQGTWIRPAQNGSETYGGGIRYQRIIRLDTLHYAEEFAGELTWDKFPGADGTHTYNRSGSVEVIDVKLRISTDRDPGAK
jgi:hypothetical protein